MDILKGGKVTLSKDGKSLNITKGQIIGGANIMTIEEFERRGLGTVTFN